MKTQFNIRPWALVILHFAFFIGLASAQTTINTNFTVGATIPDGSAVGLASFKTLAVPITSITDLNVTLKVSGTFNGDLYCYLTHSSGFTVLLNRPGRRAASGFGYSDSGLDVTFDNGAANGDVHVYRLTLNGNHSTPIVGPLTGAWAPDGRTNNPTTVLDTHLSTASLSDFNGLDANGEWVLFVADLASGDVHTLDSWGLSITGTSSSSITTQPASQTAECATGSATFSVVASGSGTLTYQWRFGGNPISGATSSSYTINNPTAANAGAYTVVVTGSSGSVTSSVATLTVIDTTAPVVSLTGSSTMTVECHTSFTDPGATASDLCAGTLTPSVSGSVNVNAVGSYTLTYTATDPSGNPGTATRTVNVVDTIAPVVTLNGSATMTVECHTSFTDPGATASDSCAGSLTPTVSGALNINAVGTYTLTYTATDPSGNPGTATRTVNVVDTTAPTVTLTGSSTMTVECHTSFTDPGATASDLCAGSLTPSVSGSVNVNTVGTYTLTYTATDPSGNPGTAMRTVNVVDTTAPVVTLTGSSTVTVECHTSFTDPGATASDLCAGTLTPSVSGSVNVNTVGTYTLTYTATDPSGNPGTATRTVNVVDTTAPVVTLTGSATMTVECHTSFTDPGATASDLCAGTLSVSVSGSVNVNAVGSYTLTYTATDPAGNPGTATRTVNVVDTTAPVVTLTGSATVTVECHTSFTDPGATASDLCAGTLTPSVSGSVNVNAVGSYTLTYTATDPSGNPGTATRTVNVVDTTAPVVTVTGSSTITVQCHTSFTDPGATASDLCAGTLSVSVSGTVNVNTVGTYTLTYTATDPSGNPGTATRTVNVVDTTAPVVTLTGSSTMTVECHTSFTDPGATASDLCAGTLTPSVSGSVNVNAVGTYTLTYTATDPSGNPGTATRTVNVVDTTAPVVTLTGSSTMTVECHTSFTDPGATASDSCAGTLTPSVSGSVNVNAVGTYTLTYTATDPSGNPGTAMRTVNVVDTTAPVVTLTGSSTMTVECHTSFTDPGATASDSCAGTLTPSVSGSVNVNAVGSYTLTYTATDPSGNPATATRTVNVVDTTAPVVTCPANTTVYTLNVGGTAVTFTATAADTCSGTLTPACSPSSGSTFVIGTTTVTCTATDGAALTGSCSFSVTVVLNHAPVAVNDTMGALQNTSQNVLISKLLLNDTDSDGDTLTIASVSATSTNGGSVTLLATEVRYTPVASFVGTDLFTYTLSDGRGGTSTASVLVQVRSGGDASNRLDIVVIPGGVRIRFAGIPGFGYSVQRSTDLTSWLDLGTFTVPENGLAQFDDINPPATSAFYRTIDEE